MTGTTPIGWAHAGSERATPRSPPMISRVQTTLDLALQHFAGAAVSRGRRMLSEPPAALVSVPPASLVPH
jgi:hypothetical protein